MQDLPPDDPKPGILESSHDKPGNAWQAIPKGLRAKILTVAWALAVLVATAGWLYLIVRGALLVLNWLVG